MESSQKELLGGLLVGALAKAVGLWALHRHHRSRFVQVGEVGEMYMYPVKSCGALSVQTATATQVGLSSEGVTDRHWMIIYKDTGGKPNMRTDPKLTLVKITPQGDKICIQAPGMPDLQLPMRQDVRRQRPLKLSNVTGDVISVDQPDMQVVDCGEAADDWVSGYLGRPCRLLYSTQELSNRDISRQHRDWENTAVEGDMTVFSYLTSYLVTSTASLKEVNSQLDDPVTSVNFRPNIVVKNSIAWDEDNWTWLKIGQHALFHRVEPCIRCTITTINPDTGKRRRDNQPLKLLRSYRCRDPYGEAPVYGSYMSCDVTGGVKVGDPVYAIVNTI